MEVVVKKWGEKMNSPHSHRRNMYIELEPATELATTLKNAANEIRILLGQWDYPSLSEWWVTHVRCKQCRTRQEYEISKFINCEWVWNRRFCMRHYLVYHCIELLEHDENIESNRYFEFGISKQEITVKFATNNYDYNVTIHRSSATLVCNYKGTKYTFTYRNHTNSLPYTSTYYTLLRAVCRFADKLQRFLAHLVHLDTNDIWYNVYINNVLFKKSAEGDQQ